MGGAPAEDSLRLGIMGAGGHRALCWRHARRSGSPRGLRRPRADTGLDFRGLSLSRYDGFKAALKPERYEIGGVDSLGTCDVVLFCTKSADTEAAAIDLARVLKADATVISLQNGVGNVEMLKRLLPHNQVVAGTVPFNVVRLSPNAVHCAMEGPVLIGPSDASTRLAALAAGSRLKLRIHDNLDAMQWGKLMLNLNNGLNVLSGLPLRRQFEDPGYRTVLAMAMEELLAALDVAGIGVIGATRTSPRLIPKVLRLPTWLFRLAARQQLRMDDTARSSSWDDLKAGREPETRFLNGAVCSLAEAHGRTAPVNETDLPPRRRGFCCQGVARNARGQASGAGPEGFGGKVVALASSRH